LTWIDAMLYCCRMKIADIFEKLGLNSARWQWRAARWERRLEELRARLAGRRQQVAYRHKFCPQCRSIVDRDDRRCPHCGAAVGSRRAQATGRALGSLIPGGASVTGILIAVNIAIYLAGVLVGGFAALIMPPEGFINSMSMIAPLFIRGQFWRIVTYGYLHFGWMHILFNMFALYQAGLVLEEEIGRPRFFVLYTLALLGGGLLNVISAAVKIQFMAGASGAVFGLIGFGAVYGHLLGGPRGEMLRSFFTRWIFGALLFTFMVPGISISAHLGGMGTGALLAYLMLSAGLARHEGIWRQLARLCAAITVAAFAWLMLALLAS
jgi:membrane associated rhomboid family serine protease